MICVTTMSRDEIDIVECSIHHMLAEGVDLIFVADQSTDGTREILESFDDRVVVYSVEDKVNRQVDVVNWLVGTARVCGADWVIPCDIDEFPYSPKGRIADVLDDLLPDKLYVKRWLHNGWDFRRVECERLPKVVFRPLEGVRVEVGAHECNLPDGVYGVIESRELQYRGFEHFKAKAADRIARFPVELISGGGGWHHERLRGMDEDQLRAEYDALLALPSVFDPIPSRTEFRPKENG